MNTIKKLQKTVKGTPKFAGNFKTPGHKNLRFEIFQDDLVDKTPASDVQDELFAFDIQGECQPAAPSSIKRLEPKTPAC